MTEGIAFGLAAPAAVRWLIGEEKQIYDRVIAFYMGHVDTEIVEVVGPPTAEEAAEVKRRGHGDTVPLPIIRLRMRLAENHKTGEHGVEVTCNEKDLAEVERWERLAMLTNLKIGKVH